MQTIPGILYLCVCRLPPGGVIAKSSILLSFFFHFDDTQQMSALILGFRFHTGGNLHKSLAAFTLRCLTRSRGISIGMISGASVDGVSIMCLNSLNASRQPTHTLMEDLITLTEE